MPIKLENVIYEAPLPRKEATLQLDALSIADGEFVGLMGSADSGKSGLLRLISGLARPTAGHVRITPPEECTHGGELRAGFYMPFSHLAFSESSLPRELSLSLRGSGLDADEKALRISEALSAVALDAERYAGLSPFALSESEKRRLALAAVLVRRPTMLLLDEPFSGLDSYSKNLLAELFARLNNNGVTVIMASNESDILSKYAGRIIVLEKGRIVCDSGAKSIFTDYCELMRRQLPLPAVRETAQRLWERDVNMPVNIISYQQFIDRLRIIVWRKEK